MKKSRFTEEQIVFALKQAELGTSVPDVCRKLGISDATFYTWRKKYGGIFFFYALLSTKLNESSILPNIGWR